MGNFKVRVNNEAESREAQELFFQLGGSWSGYNKIYDWPKIKQLYLGENYITFSNDVGFFVKDSSKEITLPELRAMVNPMKEYLEPLPNGEYKYHSNLSAVGGEWLEIPEGAECLTRCKDHNDDEWLLFWKGDYKFCVGHDKEWFYFESGVSEYLDDWCGRANIIWQRDTSLNDHEQVRQSAYDKQEGGSHYKKLAIQPMQYALANKLDYAQANVVKYVTRHADKNGKEDLLKAIHNIELMIEHYYSDS